jgi:transcriptional regulator with XRE-family HTH domain
MNATTGRREPTMKAHRALGANLRRLRNRRGFSLRELAQAMRDHNDGDALGLDHAELSRLENGRRQATIEQWLLLAAALDCPPVLLLVPLGDDDVLEVTAGSKVHPHLALRWIVGEVPLATTERHAVGVRAWHRMRLPLTLYERLWEAQEAVEADQPYRPLPPTDAKPIYRQLAEVLVALAEGDVAAPALSPWCVGRLAQCGHHPDRLGIRVFTPDDWYVDFGARTSMRHPALPEPFDIPAELVEDFRNGGWDDV